MTTAVHDMFDDFDFVDGSLNEAIAKSKSAYFGRIRTGRRIKS